MAGLGVDLSGLDDADRRLARFAAQMADLRPFWPKVSDLFVDWMGDQFATEGGALVTGGKWARLSPEYAARKAVTHPGKGILVAEGDLKKAAQTPVRTAGPQNLTLAIHDRKVGWHQDGTAKMPARPLIPNVRLPDAWQRDLDRVAEEYVREVARRELGVG